MGQYENIMKSLNYGKAVAVENQRRIDRAKAVVIENQRRIDSAKAQAHYDAGSTQVMLGDRYATLLTRLDKVIALLEEKAK